MKSWKNIFDIRRGQRPSPCHQEWMGAKVGQRRPRRAVLICFFFGLGILLLSCPGCGKKKAAEIPAHPVEVGQSYSRTVSRYIDTIGSCVSPSKVLIIPQVSGQIVKIHFVQGQEVKTGDLLYTIDPRLYQAALDKARGQLGEDEAQLELNRLVLERNMPLASGLYVSPQDLDKYRLQVDMLEATLKADQATVETAQINLGYCFITSPVNGKTGVYLVNEGNVVAANDPKGLVSIQTIVPIYAEFIVTEREMMQVRRQMLQSKIKTEITSIEDATIKEYGDLFFLDNEVKPKAGTVTLRSVCQNQKELLWPGQFINARILLDEIKNAVLAPYAAVQISARGPFTFVLKSDATVDIRPIKLGQSYGDDIVIEEGVKAGEQLITSGQLMLRPGSRVKIVTPSNAKIEK